MEMISVCDIEMAYRIFGTLGQGIPLVMITGFGCLMEMWPSTILEELAKTRPVIVFDNRGMGFTTDSEKDFSIELFAEDVYGLLKALNIERADVLGWSMGGFIAQEFALTHPEMVGKLILQATSCGGAEAVWASDDVWRKLVDISGTLEVRVQRMLENLFPTAWLRATPNPMRVFPPITAPIKDRNILRQAAILKTWRGSFKRLPTLANPVLIIMGTDDVVMPASNAAILAGRLPNASVKFFEQGGHGFQYQYPETTAQHISAFLQQERMLQEHAR